MSTNSVNQPDNAGQRDWASQHGKGTKPIPVDKAPKHLNNHIPYAHGWDGKAEPALQVLLLKRHARSADNGNHPTTSKSDNTEEAAAAPQLPAPPAGINSHTDAYKKASWKDHAIFFQLGQHVEGNQHLRRYQFTNGSYVVIQAHVPKLSFTSESDAMVASAFFGGMGAGMLAAMMGLAEGAGACGPVGIAAGLTIGALVGGSVSAAVAAQARPHDAAWQGYTVNYYEKDTAQAWSWYRFYGWKRSDKPITAITIDGEKDPNRFANFADQLEGITWHRWDTLRPSAERPKSATTEPPHATQQLVQAMAQFSPSPGSGHQALPASHVPTQSTPVLAAAMV